MKNITEFKPWIIYTRVSTDNQATEGAAESTPKRKRFMKTRPLLWLHARAGIPDFHF